MPDLTHARIDEIEALEGFLVGHIVRLGPTVKRKVTPGPDGLRLLALGAVPGKPYDTGGTL